MKKIIILLLFGLNMLFLRAQSVGTQTLNSTGSTQVVGNLHLEWSVGEMTAVQTLSSPGLLITQGLLQPITTLTSPLPVNLLYFTGKTIDNQNHLSWATAQEINNHHFDVERSANGINFQFLEQVAGAGNSSVAKTYNLADPLPYPITWYRLRQVDIDGNFSYSPIIRLQLNSAITFGIYPNPTTGILNLSRSSNNQSVQVVIFDLSGKLVLQKNFLSGTTLPIDVRHLSNGSYIIQARELLSGKNWSAKFIKQ